MANTTKLNRKFGDKLKHKTWQLDNAAGWNRLADEVLVDEKTRTSGCFAAVVAVLTIAVPVLAMAFGAGANTPTPKPESEVDKAQRLIDAIVAEFKRDTNASEAAQTAKAKIDAMTAQVQRMNEKREEK